jgi:eukaryotic-like serine/threonine-protein kinase
MSKDSLEKKIIALRNIQFFNEFKSNHLQEVLLVAQWVKYAATTEIFHEGDEGDCFYIIIAGEVDVIKGTKRLAILKQGDCFGEMALVANIKRTATIRAHKSAILMKLNDKVLNQVSTDTQLLFYKSFSSTLVERLNQTSVKLSQKWSHGYAD